MPLANTPNLLGRGIKVRGGVTPSVGNVVGTPPSTTNALAVYSDTTGLLIKNSVVTQATNSGNLTGGTDQTTTTAAGLGYTNQPANDTVEFVSSSALDVQSATVIGTTNGGNVVVVETVVLTGTTPVATIKSNWGVVLAIKLSSAAVGTITVREGSADQTITTLAPAATSSGVTTVTNTAAFNQALSTVASGATTKQIGWGGTDTSNVQIYDSKPLNGTTAVTSNSSFFTLTEIYRGDLEATRTVTVTTNGTWTLTGGGGGVLTFVTGSTGVSFSGSLGLAGQNPTSGTGVLQLPAGAADNTSGISFGSDSYLFRLSAGSFRFKTTSATSVSFSFNSANQTAAILSLNDSTGATTFGSSGGTFLTGDSSLNATGVGYLNGSQFRAVIKTQAASPYAVTATTDNRQAFTNEGTSALVTFNLPTAAANLDYTFIVQDADGIRVVANTGDTIRIAGSVSASAGRIDSTTVGSTVRLIAINSVEWISVATNGTWVIT